MKRTKEVWDSWNVARLWANQLQPYARNPQKNFHYRNLTLYSYGSGYIVGYLFPWGTVINCSKYSTTTAKHQRIAANAVVRTGYHYLEALTQNLINSPRDLALAAAKQSAEFFATALAKRGHWQIQYELKQARERMELCKLASSQAPRDLRKAILKTLPVIPDGEQSFDSLRPYREAQKRNATIAKCQESIARLNELLPHVSSPASGQGLHAVAVLCANRRMYLDKQARKVGIKIPRSFPSVEHLRLTADSARALFGVSP